MTAMPQMVALFNGVGGGAVALIAWVGVPRRPTATSASTWTSASRSCSPRSSARSPSGARTSRSPSCRSSSAGQADQDPRRQQFDQPRAAARSPSAAACAIARRLDDRELLFIAAARRRGDPRQLRRAADRRRRHAGRHLDCSTPSPACSAAATGIALDNTALIVAGMIVGASGTILTQLMAEAMNRSISSVVARRLRRRGRRRRPGRRATTGGTVRSTSAADAAIQMAYARQVVVVPGYGMAVAQAQHAVRELAKALEARGVEVKFAIHPVAGPHAGPHERPAGRGRRALRPAQGDGRHQRRVRPHRRRRWSSAPTTSRTRTRARRPTRRSTACRSSTSTSRRR